MASKRESQLRIQRKMNGNIGAYVKKMTVTSLGAGWQNKVAVLKEIRPAHVGLVGGKTVGCC